MPKSETLHIRLSPELKTAAEVTLNQMGLTTSDAVNIFLRQVVNSQSIPFAIKNRVPNDVTLAAMMEAETIAAELDAGTRKGYNSVKDLMSDLNA